MFRFIIHSYDTNGEFFVGHCAGYWSTFEGITVKRVRHPGSLLWLLNTFDKELVSWHTGSILTQLCKRHSGFQCNLRRSKIPTDLLKNASSFESLVEFMHGLERRFSPNNLDVLMGNMTQVSHYRGLDHGLFIAIAKFVKRCINL